MHQISRYLGIMMIIWAIRPNDFQKIMGLIISIDFPQLAKVCDVVCYSPTSTNLFISHSALNGTQKQHYWYGTSFWINEQVDCCFLQIYG